MAEKIALALARAELDGFATMRQTKGCDLAEIAARKKRSMTVTALNVDDDASLAAFFAISTAAEPIDVLINNAGILSMNAETKHLAFH